MIVTTTDTACLPPPTPESTKVSPRRTPQPHRLRTRPLHKAIHPPTQSPRRLSWSPSKTRLSSRKSSPVKGTFLAYPARPRSFTPRRTRQPPCAWERRPATQFVPRADGQKIWKRVPLGDLGVGVNVPVSISRRDQDGAKDYARVVKKLKIGQKDQENEIVRQDLHEEGPLSVSSFVGTRLEDDQIHGSPRKKLGHLHNAPEDVLDAQPDMHIVHEVEDEHATEDEDNDVADRQELTTPSYADTDMLQHETESVVEGLDNCIGDLPVSEVQGEHDYTMSHISLAFVSEGQRPSTTLDTGNELAVVPEIEDASDLSGPESAMFENDLKEMAATQKDSPMVESAEADEPLFLQNFVQKSKAEKEARETELSNDTSADTLIIAPSFGNTPEDAEVQTPPLRRSKRAAVTGMPLFRREPEYDPLHNPNQ